MEMDYGHRLFACSAFLDLKRAFGVISLSFNPSKQTKIFWNCRMSSIGFKITFVTESNVCN